MIWSLQLLMVLALLYGSIVMRSRGGAASSPPTKPGKSNGYRQTNARTVYIIKYIKNF